MTIRRYWKKTSLCIMAGMMVTGLWGCGHSQKDVPSEAMSTQMKESIKGSIEGSVEEGIEAMIPAEVNIENYLMPGVVLPEGYENMIYPLEALAVEYYSQAYPYYQDGENEDSFWFSMAVLSSLMSENGLTHPEYEEEYNLFSREELDLYASALYKQYATGEMQLPALREDSPYAYYDEDTQRYGLLVGNIGDLAILIQEFQQVEDGYEVEFQLMNLESDYVITEFRSKICPQNNPDKNTMFVASVCDFAEKDSIMEEEENQEMKDHLPGGEEDFAGDESTKTNPSDADDSDSMDSQQNEYEEDGEEDIEDSGDDSEILLQDRLIISRSEAARLARSYMGDGVECTYKQMITIGDYQYYDFSIRGEGITYTDVLVHLNGIDVFGGIHNSDGSWTFDQ